MSVVSHLRKARDMGVTVLAARLGGRPRQLAWLLQAVRLVPLDRARARLYRGFSWPLVRAVDVRLVVPTTGGRMEVDTGDAIGQVIAVSGTWEPNVTAVVERLLRPGDVFVDLGAHTGYYTLLAADLVGADGHVFAFEPSPARYAELVANVTRSSRTNVTAFERAAGSGDGTATLYDAPRANTGAATLSTNALAHPVVGTAAEYRPVAVDVVAAESVLPAGMLSRVRVVKVDVEGYEKEAIGGIEQILAIGARVAVVVELSPLWSGEGSTWVERLCARHRLEPWLVDNEYNVPGYFPVRPRPPRRLASIPAGRCDLLLARGFDPVVVAGASRGSS